MPDLPCQICNDPQESDRRTTEKLICIGKISHLCRPPDDEVAHLQESDTNNKPYCNYAESIDGRFTSDSRHAGMFSSSYMLFYPDLNTSMQPEDYSRIQWAKAVKSNLPILTSRAGLKVDSDEPPCPLAFPICSRCARLVRNYLAHRFANKPPRSKSEPYGYDLLYESLVKRFMSANKGTEHPASLYLDADSDQVYMLGRAVVVQQISEIKGPGSPVHVGVDVFSQIPSLRKWIISKLPPINPTGDVVKAVELPVNRLPREANPLLDLPIELVDQITWHLNRPSILALRSTHTTFVRCLPLDQAFWFNELLFGEPPLFGFEPLFFDVRGNKHPGEPLGRIDALGELGTQFTRPRTRSKYFEHHGPSTEVRKGMKMTRWEWKDYDWKDLVQLLATSAEFEDEGNCADAPVGFRARRQLWGTISRLVEQQL